MYAASSHLLEAAQACWRQGRSGEALAMAMQALQAEPSCAEGWEFAAHALLHRKKWQEARQLLAIAVELHPKHAVLRSYYALALTKTGALHEAYSQAGEALRLHPDLPQALLARIEILCDAGHYDRALADSARLPLQTMPETAAFCQGSLAFLTGDFTRGMRLIASVIKSGWHGKDLPEWNGEPAPDKHVILYNGQAYGDLLQFIRYIDVARQRADSITLQAPAHFHRLLRDSFAGLALTEEIVPDDAAMRCALSSLPAFADPFDPLPQSVPYLKANAGLAAVWNERLAAVPRPRIGLVWSSPWQMNNPYRVADFDQLKPLLEAGSRHLVSLQMGEEAGRAAAAGIFDASPFIKDFADSAALMSELDLIISLDSAPAHLAGGLGRPVWVFLPFIAEWRWLAGREDSIWYPTMRLFRQNSPQDWTKVFKDIGEQLKLFLSGKANVLRPASWDGRLFTRHPQAETLPDSAERTV